MGKCTMPWMPFSLRKKFEDRFHDLCESHDEEYGTGDCKLCADWRFALGIGRRGYWWLSPIVFFAVNLPWVWGIYVIRRIGK